MAQEMGGSAVRLHTLPAMAAAKRLYRSMGFVSTAAVINSACREDLLMELQLK